MGIFRKKIDITESDAAREHRLGLIDGLTFEVVPMKSLSGALEHLPAGCEVSVTCSPSIHSDVSILERKAHQSRST